MTDTKGPRADAARGEPVAWQHTWDFCPNCGNGLDTGNECTVCEFDLRKYELLPLPAPAPAGSPDFDNRPAYLAAAPSAPPTDSVSSGTALGRTGASQCPTSAGEREAFEAWLHTRCNEAWCAFNLRRGDYGQYLGDGVEGMWNAWQARASQCQSEAAEREARDALRAVIVKHFGIQPYDDELDDLLAAFAEARDRAAAQEPKP